MKPTARDWITRLQLQPHPEGGWFRESYRAPHSVATPQGSRGASTAIYYLLQGNHVSHFHRIRSDEAWHFYAGDALEILVLGPEGLHSLPLNGEGDFQQVVPAGLWFGARLQQPQPEHYALVGCTVAPGFDFADFELAQRSELLAQWPAQAEVIKALTALKARSGRGQAATFYPSPGAWCARF